MRAWSRHDARATARICRCERALRRAAGNPNGTASLALPKSGQADRVPDPKGVLHRALVAATELTGRRREKVRPAVAAHQLAELVEDFAPLRMDPAFQALDEEIRALAERWLAR